MTEVYLFDRRRRTYLNSTPDGFTDVSKKVSANTYKSDVATNMLNSNIPKSRRQFIEIVKCDSAPVVEINPERPKQSDTVVQSPAKPKLHMEAKQIISNAVSQLDDEISMLDLEFNDIYHFMLHHANLPAHKGYKLYKKMTDVLVKRSEVKLLRNKMSIVMKAKIEPYKARTNTYEELEQLISS